MTTCLGFQKQFADENLRLKIGLPFYKQHSSTESPFGKSDSLMALRLSNALGVLCPSIFY